MESRRKKILQRKVTDSFITIPKKYLIKHPLNQKLFLRLKKIRRLKEQLQKLVG
jgi:hypothetical protein